MPSEDDLRQLFRDDRPAGAIDLDAVLRRSRARRRPRVAAAALASSLAVVGIVVPVSISVASQLGTTSSAGSAASARDLTTAAPAHEGNGQAGASGGVRLAPARQLNLCAQPVSTPAPAADGLVLTVHPVDAAAGAHNIPVTVTLTNTGEDRVTGSLSPFPALTLSRDGVVIWHSNGAVPSLAQQIDLAPGASAVFHAAFDAVVCGVEDDAQLGFRAGLPAASAGDYRLSAAIDVSLEAADPSTGSNAVLVSGPSSPVTLH